MLPELIYCAGKNRRYAEAAIAAGWRYGAQLPCTTYGPVWFADQNWKRPDRAKYMAALAEHRPAMATVIDLERPDQLGDTLSWAEEAARHCRKVLIIPKYSGAIDSIPRAINGSDIILAYSVPTAYGGTPVPLWEFTGWPVHLLGGSPHRQMMLTHYLDVVSADGNMANKMSHAGRFWHQERGPKGHWRNLREFGIDYPTDNNLAAFRLSCTNIMRAWQLLFKCTPPLC